MEIGINGATKIKKYFDSKIVVKSKLNHIFQSSIEN
jgi:hypothetical protein